MAKNIIAELEGEESARLLAGMTVGIARGMPLDETLRLGVACGAANALAEETGYATRASVNALGPRVRVQRMEL